MDKFFNLPKLGSSFFVNEQDNPKKSKFKTEFE